MTSSQFEATSVFTLLVKTAFSSPRHTSGASLFIARSYFFFLASVLSFIALLPHRYSYLNVFIELSFLLALILVD